MLILSLFYSYFWHLQKLPALPVIGSITSHCSHQLFVLNEMRHPPVGGSASRLVNTGLGPQQLPDHCREQGLFFPADVKEVGCQGWGGEWEGAWLWVPKSLQFCIVLVKQASKVRLTWIPWAPEVSLTG